MGSFAIVWVGLVFVALSGISFYVIPKTWDQTRAVPGYLHFRPTLPYCFDFPRLWRTCLIMTYVCVYLMWAVTYMAQLHPLIAPQRSDLKIEH
ncbi:hypothetical protein H4R33_004325 [Dimargaris cristalligena]|nr:hypothetical protein H4R33_004325 [Dimargaris cristalligena]